LDHHQAEDSLRAAIKGKSMPETSSSPEMGRSHSQIATKSAVFRRDFEVDLLTTGELTAKIYPTGVSKISFNYFPLAHP